MSCVVGRSVASSAVTLLPVLLEETLHRRSTGWRPAMHRAALCAHIRTCWLFSPFYESRSSLSYLIDSVWSYWRGSCRKSLGRWFLGKLRTDNIELYFQTFFCCFSLCPWFLSPFHPSFKVWFLTSNLMFLSSFPSFLCSVLVSYLPLVSFISFLSCSLLCVSLFFCFFFSSNLLFFRFLILQVTSITPGQRIRPIKPGVGNVRSIYCEFTVNFTILYLKVKYY